MEGILYIQLQKECSHQIPQASFSRSDVPPMLKFAKALNGREMVQHQASMLLLYVPYKKCKSLQNFVVKFARKIWRAKDVPADWAQAFIVLLSKSNDLASVAEFRPIAITSTIGKIFFSVVAERLQFFMHMIKTILFQERSKKVF